MLLGKHMRATALSVALCLSFVPAPAIRAAEVPEWPSEQEQALKSADKRLLEVQRARFRARFFGKDKDEAKDLDKQLKEAQKERNQLLEATGRR